MSNQIGSETDTDREEIERVIPSDPALLSMKVMMAIAEKVSPDQVADCIRDMLLASYVAKGEEKPDWRAREAAVKYYLAYFIGQPVQRQHIVNERRSAPTDPMADLQGSKAAMQALVRMLASSPEGREALNEELGTIDT